MTSRTILTHLINGNPDGMRLVEFSNRLILGIAFPRAIFDEAIKRSELNNSGVYFLFGEDENEKQKVYIGQSLNIGERLKNHLKSSQKDFWLNTVCFTNGREKLDSADINFLENQLIMKSTQSGKIIVENSTSGNKEYLSEFEISDMQEFLIDLGILLGTLGYPILTPLVHKNKSGEIINNEDKMETIYYLRRGDCDGKMIFTNDGFIVLKGSIGQSLKSSGIRDGIGKRRERLISEGIISIIENNKIIFLKDYAFKSPSGGGMIIAGSAINGWGEWKDENGTSIGEYENHWQ